MSQHWPRHRPTYYPNLPSTYPVHLVHASSAPPTRHSHSSDSPPTHTTHHSPNFLIRQHPAPPTSPPLYGTLSSLSQHPIPAPFRLTPHPFSIVDHPPLKKQRHTTPSYRLPSTNLLPPTTASSVARYIHPRSLLLPNNTPKHHSNPLLNHPLVIPILFTTLLTPLPRYPHLPTYNSLKLTTATTYTVTSLRL
eukprot:XP_011661755.1 PREDICTED: protein HOMOLOG OF MAMMALIAN LYST-INTERACTING PROTEIN 5-like [Strongylocentrotus purpuratus]